MDGALHIPSGCQCPAIRNMVIEHHNIASKIILKVVIEGYYGSNLVNMGVCSTDHLAQHDLHITEQVSNRALPSNLFKSTVSMQSRRNNSRPDAILVTPHPTNPSIPPTSPFTPSTAQDGE
eukprot:1037255-Pelagomonas_calceolata.AAC.1